MSWLDWAEDELLLEDIAARRARFSLLRGQEAWRDALVCSGSSFSLTILHIFIAAVMSIIFAGESKNGRRRWPEPCSATCPLTILVWKLT